MSESPPYKKQKLDNLVFKSQDLEPDVRITVFASDFRVHSSVLKLHSRFFLKFLDSPEKPASPPSALYKYDYISVVDGDGESWGLEPVSMIGANLPSLGLQPEGENEERTAFGKLLCAMYGMVYEVRDLDELKIITRLADYYRALPILSLSLYKVLWNCPGVIEDIYYQSFAALRLGIKLRHTLLFRDAMIHVVGEYSENFDDMNHIDWLQDDKALRDLIGNIRQRFCTLKGRADRELWDGTVALERPHMMDHIRDVAGRFRDADGYVQKGAIYYREVERMIEGYPQFGAARDALARLLKNNLVLDANRVVGTSGYDGYYFFCVEVRDEDLPWDATETDW